MVYYKKQRIQEEHAVDIRDFYNAYQHHTPGLLCSKREYAVLVPLIETEQGLCLLYEVRSGG